MLRQNNTIQAIHLDNNASEAALSGSSGGTTTMNTVTSGSINCTTEHQHASCERRPRRTRFHGHGGLPDAPMMRMEHYDD